MKYVTIVGKDFEEAVHKARENYGPALRIHSRRDVMVRGGFLWMSKRPRVEITCYLVDPTTLETKEKHPLVETESPKVEAVVEETPVENEVAPSKKESLLAHARMLLELNDFSSDFLQKTLNLLQDSLEETDSNELSVLEFELIVVDKIVSLIRIDHETQLHPPHIFVVLGPTGVGKTTTLAKIAALYGLQNAPEYKRSVSMITIDSFRAGAFEQLKAFGTSLGIEVEQVANEEEFYRALTQAEDSDLVLVDTIGKSPRDKDLAVKMKTLLSVPNSEKTRFYLVISSVMKTQDILKAIDQYSSFGISSIIITKLDESETIGNVLSVCHQRELPILFFTDGQRVPKDIHKASASTMLGQLKGFSLDFETLWTNQIGTTLVAPK